MVDEYRYICTFTSSTYFDYKPNQRIWWVKYTRVHMATPGNAPQHTAPQCKALHHPATHYNNLQQPATQVSTACRVALNSVLL